MPSPQDNSNLPSIRSKDEPYKLPVSILSGFLGSGKLVPNPDKVISVRSSFIFAEPIVCFILSLGKMTLLSHILSNYENLKVAILVNDMGKINIDAALIQKHSKSITLKEEHLVEMSNGCICCTLREDLLIEVAKIFSQGTFDYLLIDSSGISEPMPVAETITLKIIATVYA